MLQFFCTLCNHPMVANEARAGTTATCPSCKGTVAVPAAAATVARVEVAAPEASPIAPPPLPSRPAPAGSITPPLPKKKKVGLLWMLLAVVATGIALVVSISTAIHLPGDTAPPPGTSPAAYHTARVMGVAVAHFLITLILAIGSALIVAVICRFAIQSFRRPLVMAFSAGMLGWALVLARMPFAKGSHTAAIAENDSQHSKEFEKRVEETTQKILAEKKVPKDPAITLPPKPTGPITSDLDRWNEVWREASAEAGAILPDYSKELKAAGLDRLIVPDRLIEDKDFSESLKIIEACQQAIKHARQRFKDLLVGSRKKVEDLHLGPQAAEEARKSMARTLDKYSGPMEEYFEVEEKIVGAFVEAARYLDSIRPYWTMTDHKLLYERQSDMEHVRSITQQIKDGRARQQEILKELATFLATKIEEGKDREGGK